jgi:NADP-dependent aldehyde dehydrogenase
MPGNATKEEIDRACSEASRAFEAWSHESPEKRATVMDAIAAALDPRRDEILRITADETALTIDELAPEFARMTGTLRMFAGLLREGSWVRAAIDPIQNPRGHAGATGAAQGTTSPGPSGPGVTAGVPNVIGPNHDIRRMLIPLGPVAVFGSSNFPLAYGVCGGDTASALAAGCPVIVKEHPAHPRTGRLIASIAQQAVKAAGFAAKLLGYVRNEDPSNYSVASAIVQHPPIRAVGFTGSLRGGLAIEQMARSREIPIPAFAEMGSLNPVRITEAALESRGDQIADALADSMLARHGQQCTRPWLIFVPPPTAARRRFTKRFADRVAAAPIRDMLAPWIRDLYMSRVRSLARSKAIRVLANGPATRGPRSAPAHLFGARISNLPAALLEEVFGPAAAIVDIAGFGDRRLPRPASLTWSIFCEPGELADAFGPAFESDVVSRRAGRIIFNGVPTGVRVASAMVHGGPFPATNRPDTTAVGPMAIERWCRPVCFQNCPDALLPPELRNANPRSILRLVNGIPTRDPIAAS